MKTDALRITQDPRSIADALDAIETTARNTGMSPKDAASMRLTAEELLIATGGILDAYQGRLWMEADDERFALHLKIATPMYAAERRKLIALSKDGTITPPKGLFSRLGAALERFLLLEDNEIDAGVMTDYALYADALYESGPMHVYHYIPQNLTAAHAAPEDELAGVEKSIMTALMDDILVTLQSGNIEITAIKIRK